MNRKGEVDFLVHCFKRLARRPVRRVLDIACGTGPHLVRLAERGYQIVGLDLSAANIAYLGERLAAKGQSGELVVGDMTDFRLQRPVDAAICMQDSQGHLLTNDAAARAICARVAANLRPGGLYVFDRYMASSWTNPARRWSWSRRRGRLIVRASFSALQRRESGVPGVPGEDDPRGRRERHPARLPADAPLAHGVPPGAARPRRPGGGLRVRPVVLRLQAASGPGALAASRC